MTGDDEKMTAWQFLRHLTAMLNRPQLALVAICEAFTVLALATWPAATGLPLWAKIAGGAAAVLLSQSVLWVALGIRRVQKWIIGS